MGGGGLFVSSAIWTGTLRRGAEANTVEGVLRDSWGWAVTLTGTRQDDGSYVLTGTLGEPPASLRVPLLDDAT